MLSYVVPLSVLLLWCKQLAATFNVVASDSRSGMAKLFTFDMLSIFSCDCCGACGCDGWPVAVPWAPAGLTAAAGAFGNWAAVGGWLGCCDCGDGCCIAMAGGIPCCWFILINILWFVSMWRLIGWLNRTEWSKKHTKIYTKNCRMFSFFFWFEWLSNTNAANNVRRVWHSTVVWLDWILGKFDWLRFWWPKWFSFSNFQLNYFFSRIFSRHKIAIRIE